MKKIKKFSKYIHYLFILFLLIVSLVFFYKLTFKTHHYILTSGEKGGIYNPLSMTIADIIQKEIKNIKITVMESQGSVENKKRLIQQQADFGIIHNDDSIDSDISTILPLYDEVLYILVSKQSGIKELIDIKGKKACLGPLKSGTHKLSLKLLGYYGIKETNFNPCYLSLNDASKKLINGEIDALFYVSGIKPRALSQLASSNEIQLIGLEGGFQTGNEAESFCMTYPYAKPFIVPMNILSPPSKTQKGIPNDPILTISIPAFLVCRHQLPEKLIYKITESIVNNQRLLVRKYSCITKINSLKKLNVTQFPYHPGAYNFINRKKPHFLVVYAEFIGLIISILITLTSIIITMKKWVENKKKNRIDRYYSKIDHLFEQLQNSKLSKDQLTKMKETLFSIRKKAFKELINEKLSPNESFIIFQLLLSECQKNVENRLIIKLNSSFQ